MKNHYTHKTITLLLIAMLCLSASTMQAQRAMLYAAVPNEAVNDIATDDNYVYIAGFFTAVGTNAGCGVKLTTTSHQYNNDFPFVNGIIETAAPDGSGGWYIGGSFTAVDGVTRNGLAHILSTGVLDAAWNPNPNSTVRAIAVSGSSIYVGGDFTSVGGQTRRYIAKLDNSNGNAETAWNAFSNSAVYTIAISGSDIYAGGTFTNIGGQSRNRIAKLNNINGNADNTWNANSNNPVNIITISGSDIYAGGSFTTIGGQNRNRISRLNSTNGNADSWNPDANNTVRAIAVSTSGLEVYAGGDFTIIGGQTRNRIAKLNTDGSANGGWNASASNTVNTIALSGSGIYAGGSFTIIGGQSRNYIARLNNTDGNADGSWIPAPGRFINAPNDIRTIAINGSDVYIGGVFASINSVTRNHIARIDRSTGVLDAGWDPNVNGTVSTVRVNGADIYIGGSFTTVGGQSFSRLAKLNGTNGNVDASWTPNANSNVFAIAFIGTDVYVGGDFTSIGGQSRNRIAKLNNTTGTADATWNPGSDGRINQIAIEGSNIYVGGDFTLIGGQSRNRFAKLNKNNNNADGIWNPDPNSIISKISVNGSDIYVAGFFTSIGGQSRNYFAKLNNSNGNADLSWNPNANNIGRCVAFIGSSVYVSGNFNSIGGLSRGYIAKLDAITGNADATWNASPNNSTIYSIVANNAAGIYLGGNHTSIVSETAPCFSIVSYDNSLYWSGKTSTDWGDATNWQKNTLPASTDDVSIYAGTPFAPDMGSAARSIKNITLIKNQTLQLNTTTLTLNGNLINYGTIDGSTATIKLGGSSAQQVDGIGYIKNLELNNSAGATLNGVYNVTGTLTATSGTLATGSYLTLKSDVNTTARVGRSAGTISGNVNVERYIPAKTERKWTYITCPVYGQTIRDGWQDEIFITANAPGGTPCGAGTGNGGVTDRYNSAGFDKTASAVASMYTYNAIPTGGSRYVTVPNTISTNLIPGIGYRMNIRGLRGVGDANCEAQINNETPPTPTALTISARGSLQQGNVNVPVFGKTAYNAQGGSGNAYTLIGNPYASEVSLQDMYAGNNSTITTSFWFYTPLNAFNVNSTYNAATQQATDFPTGYSNGSGVTDVIIASGQAFFVERSGNINSNVVFQEAHKSTTEKNGNAFYKTQANITNKIRVKMQSMANAELKNEIFINYLDDPGASELAITPFDSYSFNTGNTFYLVSQKAGKNMSIQTKPSFNGNDTVALSIKADIGEYKFLFDEFNTFTSATEIKLVDNFIGSVTDIRLQPNYSFSITSNTASQGNARFKIVFRSAGVLPVTGIVLKGTEQSQGIQLNWNVTSEVDMNNYIIQRSADAKEFAAIGTVAALNTNPANYGFFDSKPLQGVGYYRIKALDKAGKTYYSETIKIQQGKIVTAYVYPNPVDRKLNMVLPDGNNSSYTLRIMDVTGKEIMRKNNIMPVAGVISVDVNSLSPGVYITQLVNNYGDVITERIVKK